MPEITDSLTNEADEQNEQGTETKYVPQVSVTSVPVNLPVGSLIDVSGGTTTFNVITPDQIQVSLFSCHHSNIIFSI